MNRSLRMLVLLFVVSIGVSACQDAASPEADPSETSTPPAHDEASNHDGDQHKEKRGNQDLGVTLVPIIVEEGQVQGPDEVGVPVGTSVRIDVRSDAADEVHVHGYDEFVPVKPGKTTSLEFTANIPGVFEVELEESGLLLFELRVEGP